MMMITFKRLLVLASLWLAPPLAAQDFPLTIEHKFGTTIIPARPDRVASLDYGGIDNLLAVGVSPVTVRQWRPMDGFAFTAGPWAAGLMTREPVLLDAELDLETIARTNPDVIIALYSGIDAAIYDKLSLIAPVVAVPEGVGDYALPWDERALLAARAVGQEQEAARRITAIRDRLARVKADHPQWAGQTAVIASFSDGVATAFTRHDGRTTFILDLGFALPAALEELSDNQTFSLDLSPEDIAPIDADVLLWYSGADRRHEIETYPARPFLRAHQTGGEVFLPDEVIAAFARLSLLSIPTMIDAMVPLLQAAADGDPATPVPLD